LADKNDKTIESMILCTPYFTILKDINTNSQQQEAPGDYILDKNYQ